MSMVLYICRVSETWDPRIYNPGHYWKTIRTFLEKEEE